MYEWRSRYSFWVRQGPSLLTHMCKSTSSCHCLSLCGRDMDIKRCHTQDSCSLLFIILITVKSALSSYHILKQTNLKWTREMNPPALRTHTGTKVHVHVCMRVWNWTQFQSVVTVIRTGCSRRKTQQRKNEIESGGSELVREADRLIASGGVVLSRWDCFRGGWN